MSRATFTVFLAALVTFLAAPVHQASADAEYTLLGSVALLRDHSLSLDRYLPPGQEGYPLVRTSAGLHSYFPPGSSVLSIPAVVAAELVSISPVNARGRYDGMAERRIAFVLAPVLMAIFVAIVFATARLALPLPKALAVTAVAALGTAVASTFSRGLWSQTWAVLLIGTAWWLVLADARERSRLSPLVLGTVLSWAYFTRPTSAVASAAIVVGLYFSPRKKRDAILTTVVGAVWLAGFIAWSHRAFGTFLPAYAMPQRLGHGKGLEPLIGNLVSPSRGLLVFTPVVGWVLLSTVANNKRLQHRPLAIAAICACVGHLAVVATFEHWWGGSSYGARLASDLLPSAIVLAVLVLEQVEAGIMVVSLSAVSLAMNLLGAFSRDTWTWNDGLGPTIERREMWSLSRAQFLAPFGERRIPPPTDAPVIEDLVTLDDPIVRELVIHGFSSPERGYRWTLGRSANLAFSLRKARVRDSTLTLNFSTFLAPPREPAQRLVVRVNGTTVFEDVLTVVTARDVVIAVPGSLLRERANELAFDLPDARSPAELHLGRDERRLGIALHSFALVPTAGAP